MRAWLVAHLYGPHAWLWIFEVENFGRVGDVKQLGQSVFVPDQFPCGETNIAQFWGRSGRDVFAGRGTRRCCLPSVQLTQTDIKATFTHAKRPETVHFQRETETSGSTSDNENDLC